jgi:hypothetical protein
MPADLRDATLWLTSVRAVSGGRACRDLTVYDTIDSRVIGALARAPLPFDTRAAPALPRLGALGRRLPVRMRTALANRLKPTGWRLERVAIPPHEDPRLSVAAAIFTVELSNW